MERGQLRNLLSEDEWKAAARTTINAHYTDPGLVDHMWRTVTDLGFTGGSVLEPGCGSGNFIGHAPLDLDTKMVGVELDPVSAAIGAKLYPQHTVINESFADTRVPPGSFDLTIGNVPFADVKLHDPRFNRGNHSIHNHFIIKSLELTRPGGIVAVITSRYTLDSGNPAARSEMAALADLVGAVRLPNGTHKRAAGTTALTDIVVFRRRLDTEAPRDDSWVGTSPRIINDEKIRINNYFDMNPGNVLGDVVVGHGQYGSATVQVIAPDPDAVGQRLTDSLASIVDEARQRGLTVTERTTEAIDVGAAAVASSSIWDGTISAVGSGFTIHADGVASEYAIPKTQAVEARALLSMRDKARQLLELEAASADDTPDIDALRDSLAAEYSDYSSRYGALNRYTLVPTGRENPVTGEPKMSRRKPPVMAKLRQDPFFALVTALEVFDEETQQAEPAALLQRRVVVQREPIRGVDTPEEALAVCVDAVGHADLEYISDLLGTTEEDARESLAELVYDDPAEGGGIVPAAEYLSGNVRTKLEQAREAAQNSDTFAVNVSALERVMPADLVAGEIEAKLGAVWIPATDVQAFLKETLTDPTVQVEYSGQNIWAVKSQRTWTPAATSQWGTSRRPAPAIAQACLEQRTITVVDKPDDGRSVSNITETLAAQEKASMLQERFSEWVWEDPERALRLTTEYNRRFNSTVLRDYSGAGSQLQLPGLAASIGLREHQRTAIARMIAEQSVLLAHAVGAGKTLECVAGVHELKRLGLVSKPAVIVPNHMLDQFSREWLQAYPGARILAASSEDLTKQKRRQFVARVASHDWDAIIMTRTAFQRLDLSPEAKAEYLQRELDEVRAMAEAAKGTENQLTVKRLERKLIVQEERVKKALDTERDAGLSFEMSGIDYIVVDEQHDYKNLETESNIARIDGSDRAADLHMKLDYLRNRHGKRVATFMTATPIANSVTEAHVMLRYLRPDLLEQAGVSHFDAWAATFGQQVTEIEMDPSGTGFRQKTRFAKFQNVPELLRMWHTFADVKTAADLKLPVPLVAARPSDGLRLPEIVSVPASDELLEYVAKLGERAERVRARQVMPDEDNMLKISGDGRRAALSMRLVDEGSIDLGKVEAAADQITAVWQANKDNIYLDPATGEPSPVPGAAQLVFCDQSTPNPARWNVYSALKDELVARGMPEQSIRFIHDAANDAEKAQLFAAIRGGHVAVCVGSTAKMGTGTNAQNRLVASHHLDAPWRPADVEQQIGRSIRQGNQNDEVRIIRYITEGSFDAFSWQTLERKDRFIRQIMNGSLTSREIDDIGDTTPSYAEVKAIASGDPLIIEKVRADTEVGRLERLERSHSRSLSSLRLQEGGLEAAIAEADRTIPRLQEAAGRTIPTDGDAFAITIDGKRFGDRVEAAHALAYWAKRHIPAYLPETRELPDLELGGHPIKARVHPGLGGQKSVTFTVDGLPRTDANVDLQDIMVGSSGTLRRLEHRVNGLDTIAAKLSGEQEEARRQLKDISEAVSRPFKHSEALTAARRQAAALEAEMTANAVPENAVDGQAAASPHPRVSEPQLAATYDAMDVGQRLEVAVHVPGEADKVTTFQKQPDQTWTENELGLVAMSAQHLADGVEHGRIDVPVQLPPEEPDASNDEYERLRERNQPPSRREKPAERPASALPPEEGRREDGPTLGA